MSFPIVARGNRNSPDLDEHANTRASANRFGRKPRVERVEEVLKFDDDHLSELRRSPGRQQVFVHEELLMLPSRILQMERGLLTTHRDKGGQGSVIGGVQARFVVPRVHLPHEFVGQALRVPLARRSLLAPNLGTLVHGLGSCPIDQQIKGWSQRSRKFIAMRVAV